MRTTSSAKTQTTPTKTAVITGNTPYTIFTSNIAPISVLDIDPVVPGGVEQVITTPLDPINLLSWILIPAPGINQFKIQTTIASGNVFLVVPPGSNQVSITTALAFASVWTIAGQEDVLVDVSYGPELLTAPDLLGNLVTVAAPRTPGLSQKWKFMKNMR